MNSLHMLLLIFFSTIQISATVFSFFSISSLTKWCFLVGGSPLTIYLNHLECVELDALVTINRIVLSAIS